MSKLVDKAKRIVDSIMGKPAAMPDHAPIGYMNRKQKRTALAQRQRVMSEPKRRKFEKRGAPGRSSKGRKPFRVS